MAADTLSRRYTLITSLDAKLLWFEFIKELYETDPCFGEAFTSLSQQNHGHYYLLQGVLFFKYKLYAPTCSLSDLLIRETHGGGLRGHFGVAKTLLILQEHFYWPRMKLDVECKVQRCITCHNAKSKMMSLIWGQITFKKRGMMMTTVDHASQGSKVLSS